MGDVQIENLHDLEIFPLSKSVKSDLEVDKEPYKKCADLVEL